MRKKAKIAQARKAKSKRQKRRDWQNTKFARMAKKERRKGQKMREQGRDKMTIFGNSNVISRYFFICIFFDKKKEK